MTTQFLNVPFGKLAYERSGSGQLVIAVPGMGDLRAAYRYLTPQLIEAGYQVVSMDVRGHGETSARWPDYSVAAIGEDILALALALDSGPAVLIGNSMAAGAAIWAAAESPEMVKALVLLDPAVRGDVGGMMRAFLTPLFARPWGPSAWIAYFKTLFPTRKPADFSSYTAKLKQNLSEPGRIEALQKMMFASKAASETRAHLLRAPSLTLMGTKDPDFKDPAAEAAWVAEQMDGTFEMIEGAGHYPHVEMPEIAGPRIIEFLKTVEAEVEYAAKIRA